MNLFYYGIWCAGVLGAVSLLMVYISYKKTIKDVSRLPYPKGKWMQQFCQDYHQLLKEHSQINNPVIFIKKRMNGRKIGPISLHRLKGTMWYAFVFSILFAGLDLVQAYRSGQWTPANPWSRPGTLIAAGGMIAALIIFRQLLAFSYLSLIHIYIYLFHCPGICGYGYQKEIKIPSGAAHYLLYPLRNVYCRCV